MKYFLAAFFLTIALGFGTAYASESWEYDYDDEDECYYCDEDDEGQDGEDGEDGADGRDGTDGIDGIDGSDGADGTNGTDGTDGADGAKGDTGPAGADGTNGVDGRVSNDINLAFDSIQIHLPQSKNHRLTLNLSDSGQKIGRGIGYAYMFEGESRTSILLGLGKAGDETVGKIGLSFEF